MVRIELWMRSTVEHITRGCSLRDWKCKFLLDVLQMRIFEDIADIADMLFTL
jgi:hypothetical protein